jgi:hypothetical protein
LSRSRVETTHALTGRHVILRDDADGTSSQLGVNPTINPYRRVNKKPARSGLLDCAPRGVVMGVVHL